MYLIRPVITCRRVFINLQLYVSYCLFIITFYNEIGFCHGQNVFDDYKPNSGLCKNEQDATCSHQVAELNVSENACRMFYHKNTSEICNDENFTGDVDLNYRFGQFSLLSYLYSSRRLVRIPAFNVTFSSIKWTHMKMRFKENDSSNASICREFRVTADIPPEFYFYFDCVWAEMPAGKSYHFQYQVSTRNSETYLYKYFFMAPDPERIREDEEEMKKLEKWEVFSVVDMSEGASRLILTGQVAPDSLNVSGYRVQLISELWDNKRVVVEKVVSPDKDKPWFRFSYNTKSRPGIYHFTVQLDHPYCKEEPNKCHVSKTPRIEIADLPPKKTLILFVGAVILTPLAIMAYFIWRRKCDTNLEPEPSGPPKFLLVYNPVSMDHVRSMVEVAQYFNKVCHVHSMIDVLGIPQSTHKDPMRWYVEAFNEADFVGIFPSPKCSPSMREAVLRSSLVYSQAEGIAQTQLRQRLCSPGARCKFFGVALPDACWETLPAEAQALKRYTLPRDLDPLLVLIGAVPQCDQGQGFNDALALAHPERETLVLTLNGGLSGSVNAAVAATSAASTPTPTPVTCCAALSTSDPDLISTSQQVTSCLTTPASSDDELSLIGNIY